MRTTLTIDDDVFEVAQTMSRVSGERLGAVVSTLMRTALRSANPHNVRRRRFPVVDIPPGTPMISMERIQQAIDDEE